MNTQRAMHNKQISPTSQSPLHMNNTYVIECIHIAKYVAIEYTYQGNLIFSIIIGELNNVRLFFLQSFSCQ
jgi:hypothetical protein